MKRHRLGASIVQETYLDKKTGERKVCATWTVRYDAASAGPRKQRKLGGFVTYDDAALWWLAQKNNPHRDVPVAEVIKPAPITFRAFAEQWLRGVKSAVSAGTFRQYESHVREHLLPSFGDLPLVDLERRPNLIEEAMASWKRKDGRAGGLSARFTKSVWSTLRTALDRAKRLRLISTNPCEFTDAPRVERKEMSVLGPAQVQAYLGAFDETDIGAAVATAIGSGCRCGEFLALRWRDLDLERRTLRVERSLERVATRGKKGVRYTLNFKDPKSKRSRRTIPLPPFVVERLRRHRLEQAERFLSAGAGRPNADTLVFENDGQPWIPTTFGMLFARLRDAAKLPRVRLHDLRHTYGLLLLQSGADLKTVSTALGPSSVAITADTYMHVAPAMLQSAADSLGALIGTERKASGE